MDLTELKRQHENLRNRHPWESARARIVEFLLKDHSAFKHIADIGSGDAYVLRSLQKKVRADRYSAVDTGYTEKDVARIKEQGATNIHFADHISRLDVTDAPADLILLLDVLEHCPDDAGVLEEITNDALSQKGAWFVVTVPALPWLFSQHDTLLGHYRRYNRNRLVGLCEKTGLDVKQSGYFFFSLVPARLLIKLLEKTGLRKATQSIDNWKKRKLPTKFISLILRLDFRLCHALSSAGIHIPGLSCYCICQKPL